VRAKGAARLLQEKHVNALPGASRLDLQTGEVITRATLVPDRVNADGAEECAALIVHRGDQLPVPLLQVAEIVEKGLGDR
jgi:hypothetical protein